MEATIFNKRSRSLSTSITMHKQSYSITKSKPKIRIIHIFAPEIIKTDVANFRELVQSLTGKPNDHKTSKTKPKRDVHCQRQVQDMMINIDKQRELEHCDQGFCLNSEIEDDEEISMTWNGNNGAAGESSGGFLNGLGEFEGFIQELDEFPYLPLSSIDASASASSNSSSSSRLLGGVFSDSHHQYV